MGRGWPHRTWRLKCTAACVRNQPWQAQLVALLRAETAVAYARPSGRMHVHVRWLPPDLQKLRVPQ